MSQFASSVLHALSGHVPYGRCFQAATSAELRGMSADALERAIVEQLEVDLNPLTQAPKMIGSLEQLVRGYNAYTSGATNLGVRWKVLAVDAAKPVSRHSVRVQTPTDPVTAQHARFAVLQVSLRRVQANARQGQAERIAQVSDLSTLLGLTHSAAHEASLVFEQEGELALPELARRLGCHPRTLQRRLREEGVGAEALRQACRLLRATNAMSSSQNLAQVAAECGYADQSHMIRAFRRSCGMPPGFFMSLLARDPGGPARPALSH